MGFAANFFCERGHNGKKKNSEGAMEHARFEPAQTAVSNDPDVQSRQKGET